MGTRADFYVKEESGLRWLGSIAWDGYPHIKHEHWDGGVSLALVYATSQADFEGHVHEMADRNDWTSPEMGWPWPWDTSALTNYAYIWNGKEVEVHEFDEAYPWPVMAGKVAFGPRSGIIVVTADDTGALHIQ